MSLVARKMKLESWDYLREDSKVLNTHGDSNFVSQRPGSSPGLNSIIGSDAALGRLEPWKQSLSGVIRTQAESPAFCMVGHIFYWW